MIAEVKRRTKHLVVCKNDKNVYLSPLVVVSGREQKFDLVSQEGLENTLGADILCKLQDNTICYIVPLNTTKPNWVAWDGSPYSITPDVFYAIQAYNIKSLLVNLAQSYKDQGNKNVESFVHKILGLLEMVFQRRKHG